MKASLALVIVSMAFAGSASAQAKYSAALPAEQQYIVANSSEQPVALDVKKVAEAPKAAAQTPSMSGISDVVAGLIRENVNGATELLLSGKVLDAAAILNQSSSATEQHSVNVRVSYDARPIGGILNIRVELVPVFGGIGSAVRPLISREFAEAIDNFDDEFIAQTITRLTRELGEEFAAKQ